MANKEKLERELIGTIAKAAQAYYHGEPIMSDEDFDFLIARLKKVNPNNSILKTPGWGYSPSGAKKVRHKIPVMGLDKFKVSDLGGDYSRIGLSKGVVVSPKLDGGSAVCYYKNGILSQVVSRGDGELGLDITSNMMHAVPVFAGDDIFKTFAVRGEIVLTLEGFGRVGGTHPRNAAVGLSQGKRGVKDTLDVRFIAYSIPWIESHMDNFPAPTKRKQLEMLREWGFEIVPIQIGIEKSLHWESVPSSLKTIKGEILPVDGIVVSENATEVRKLGNGIGLENASIALKYADVEYETSVVSVEWNTSRTGRVVPVAVLDPVVIDGVTISRVTCYNVKFITDNGIGSGAKVKLIRSNAVIPKITQLVQKASDIKVPYICFDCQKPLKIKDTDLYCPNPKCFPKLENVVSRMFDLVKPDGIGGTTIDVILGDMRPKRRRNFKLSFLLKRLTRRFDIPKEKWEKKFGPHVGGLVFTMFSDLKDRRFTVSEVMWISNIPHVGGKAGENFQGVSSKEFTAAFRSKEYSKWRGLFPTITSWESFLTNAYRIRIILRWLGWKVRSDAKTTVRFHVAVTGSLSVSREEWFNKHPEAKEVSISKADYLVTNAPSSSAKFKEAEAKGVEVVSEDKFEALYGRDKK